MANDLLYYLTLPKVLGPLSEETQQALQAELDLVRLAPNQTLFYQGDPGDSLYVLVEGRLAIQIQNSTGEAVVVEEAIPYQVIGELALLTGQRRGATVSALEEATLVKLSKAGFERLEQSDPLITMSLVQNTLPRLRQQQLLQILTNLFGKLDTSSLAELEQKLEWRYLVAGDCLIRQGEASDAAYIVVHGRLRVTVQTDSEQMGEEQFVAVRGAGEIVGESGLLTGAPRTATITALRSTTVVRLSLAVFEALTIQYPHFMLQVARILAGRQMSVSDPQTKIPAALTFALVASDPATPITQVAEHLVNVLRQWGETLYLSSARFDEAFGKAGAAQTLPDNPLHLPVTGWLSEQENRYRFIIYQADHVWSPWTERCTQQADRILLVKRAQGDPALDPLEEELATRYSLIPQELILLQLDGPARPIATGRWLQTRRVTTHHHVRMGNADDWQRLARRIGGRAVALVLSGGGARGNAHLGVIRALIEANIPIDLIGGASFGAVIGSLYAFDLDYEQAMQVAHSYSSKQKLLDYTLPFTSLIAGAKGVKQFQKVFGEAFIEDMRLPFFCVSCNISRATTMAHQQGLLWLALRASTAIPGVFAPVLYEGDILVDGGVVNNFPVGLMRQH